MAVGERDGAAAGLAELDTLDAVLAGYPLWHASRAELLHRLGRTGEAATARDAALALETNEAVRRHLLRRQRETSVAEHSTFN